MRRSVAVAIAAGTAMAGLAVAAPAEAAAPAAAPGKGRFVTKNGWKTIEASGAYTRKRRQVNVAFTLKDTAKDRRTACVRFRFEPGKGQGKRADVQTYFLRVWIPKKRRWFRADEPMAQRGQIYSYMTGHALVRECSMNPRNGKAKFGPWKKLY
jgi:hypothetical protein